MKMNDKNVMFQNILTLMLVCLCSSYNEEWLNYSAFDTLPAGCMTKSCSAPAADQTARNDVCDCDATCEKYGTCCFDSPYTTLKESKLEDKREKCARVPGTGYVAFIINNCHPDWNGNEETRSLCENSNPSKRDPFSMIPVTNTFSNATYTNYFCAICNFEEQNIVLWNLALIFLNQNAKYANVSGHEDILWRLVYNKNRSSWGIWRNDSGDVGEFIAPYLGAMLPSSVQTHVKMCDANLISKCMDTCSDETLRGMCQSYISPLILRVNDGQIIIPKMFRNPHCALCNNITNFEEADCSIETAFGVGGVTPPLSFTLLLDVNPSSGDKVGGTSSCSEKEVYDPFFKKCRNLVCVLPGKIVRNGKCENA